MEEENKVALEESEEALPEQELQEEVAPQEEAAQDAPPKKSLKGLIQYIKTHENLRQLVLFTLFSMICGATQMLITLLLPIILKAISPDKMNAAAGWIAMGDGKYFFDFTDEGQGLGSLLGWLIGSIWGQALTFILNRKKTFNAPDHLVFRAIAYTIMAIIIVFVQTALGKIEGVLKAHDPDASSLVNAIYNLIAQVVAGLAAFTINFLGNKFVIMRKFKSTRLAEQAAAEQAAAEQGEQAESEPSDEQ